MPWRKYEKVEQERGKGMKHILAELYDQHKNSQLVADTLGISKTTLAEWRARSKCKLLPIVQYECAEEAEPEMVR